ncbi:hypothetical protein [Hymenobacter sp. AT01-02]|uniref:hypothetical protein n=1 Tax=Hymenobacter sp. AT01-02 TaxID=1571877 RepID=UPI0005F0D5CA|nr:hypothetical protein [Hymenobacter sp. AT01-02]
MQPLPDFIRLSYRSDLQTLFLRWTRPATTNEHHEGYRQALQLARQEQVSRWMIDLRSRGLAEVKDLRWVLHEFRTLFIEALPTATRRIAYFTAPYHADILRPRLLELDQNNPLAPAVEIRVFTEELPAQQWLQQG